jgi:hypothetical protein
MQNKRVLNLNLSNNYISDKGAFEIANVGIKIRNLNSIVVFFLLLIKALRTNRTLLTLNLANNQIGDNGAKSLASVS